MRFRPPKATGHIAPDAKALAWATSDFITDREIVAGLLEQVPRRLHLPAVAAWARRHKAAGNRAANIELREMADAFAACGLDFSASDDDIIALAKSRARDVRGHVMDHPGATTSEAVRDRLERYARTAGVAPPQVKSLRGLVVRMTDEKWWRRALRRAMVRELERQAIRLGFVHRRAGLYASDEAVDRRAGQRKRNRRVLEQVEAENDSGERFTLAELASHNVSNPAVRRAELMTRIAGFEEFAQARGDAAMFYTITAPSRMHARLAKSGEANPKYDGTSPRGAQEHLRRMWARARAKLHRRGAWVYGFRIAEPHHDGTPHWHLLLFMRPEYAAGVTAILEGYAHETDAEELSSAAAREARFKAVAIDWSRGSAAGYVAKYVAKNVDGFNVGDDFEAEGAADASDTVRRVDAWASTWGIRQFQQVGGPGVTIWRELRRLNGSQQLPLFDELLEAADGGRWADYVRRMGGIEIRRRDRTLSLWRVDYEKENRYGEPSPPAVEGVEHFALELCRTRMREWQIIGGLNGAAKGAAARQARRGAGDVSNDSRDSVDALAGSAGGVRGIFGGKSVPRVERAGAAAVAFDVPWTGVNNCTRAGDSTTCDAWIADYERSERQRPPP